MIDLIKSAAKRMLLDFEDSARLEHYPTKGRAREFAVFEQFLRPYLPARYSISSGVVIDANSRQSKQLDLVVYDGLFCPKLLDMQFDKILFMESVLAVLEVKSALDRAELRDIMAKSASVWGRGKSPQPSIYLAPGMTFPVAHAPVLCTGIAFESRIALDAIVPAMREIRGEVRTGHALSILCVLRDKKGNAGLVLNVSADDLQRIQLIPSSSSRLCLVECESSGDALLYFYLLLMEHLRYSGFFTPGPNLFRYAHLAGLKLRMMTIPKDETVGAWVEIEGRKTSVDALERFRTLSMKVFQGTATNEEILDWYVLLPQIPSGDVILDPASRFFVNGELADMPSPLDVYRAVKRCQTGSATDTDKEAVKQLIALIRSIYSKKAEIWVGASAPREVARQA